MNLHYWYTIWKLRKKGYEIVPNDELDRIRRWASDWSRHTCPYGELPQKVRQLEAELEGQRLVNTNLAARLIECESKP